MTETEEPQLAPEAEFAPRNYIATMPTWKKILIGAALLMIIGAAVLMAVEDPQPKPADGEGGMSALNANGPEGDPAATPWSAAFFRFGFSFFIGFAVGYACRAFLKLLFFFVGGVAIVLFLLSYYGWVIVDWKAMDAAFESMKHGVTGQFEHFRAFITGSLPNAGLAGLGLFAGFKRNR